MPMTVDKMLKRLKEGYYIKHNNDEKLRKELNAQFHSDALEASGLSNNPKRDAAFELAFETCRYDGHEAIFTRLLEYASLL